MLLHLSMLYGFELKKIYFYRHLEIYCTKYTAKDVMLYESK